MADSMGVISQWPILSFLLFPSLFLSFIQSFIYIFSWLNELIHSFTSGFAVFFYSSLIPNRFGSGVKSPLPRCQGFGVDPGVISWSFAWPTPLHLIGEFDKQKEAGPLAPLQPHTFWIQKYDVERSFERWIVVSH
jgi:hypothetical protein